MKTERQKMLAGELYFAPPSLSLAQAPYHRSDISMALSVTCLVAVSTRLTLPEARATNLASDFIALRLLRREG
ncbi:hypothetical protein ABIB87_002400 [Bradyrhizobium sp. JR18.2]|jgi:hypothetical protein